MLPGGCRALRSTPRLTGCRISAPSGASCRRGRQGTSRGLLPEPIDEKDLAQLMGKLFPSASALRALEATPPELFAQLLRDLGGQHDSSAPWAPLLEHLTDACSLLALRISATGLSDVIRARSPKTRLKSSPFHRLPR